MKQQFLKDKTGTIQTYVYEDNLKIVPTSALITIYKPGSNTKLIDGAVMNVDGDGLLYYSLSVANNSTSDENYKAEISYVYGGESFSFLLFYDVVMSLLSVVITDDDVLRELPQLRDNGWRTNGIAESGTITTLVDTELQNFSDDYFTGGSAYSIDKDEKRTIADFISSTGTITTEAFSSAINSDKYVLTRSYRREIERAFEKIKEKLARMGRRSDLILDSYDLREVHLLFTVSEVSKSLSTVENSFWWKIWKDFEKRGEEIFANINFDYAEES